MINLDSNAITPILPEILEKVVALVKDSAFLNPSSVHGLGKIAKEVLEESKLRIEQSLKAKCHDIYFVSGATEGNNMVLNSQEFSTIFTLRTEHESILSPAMKLGANFIKVDGNGLVDLNSFEEQIADKKNFLCSVMLVNNESGIIQDLGKIAEIVHKHGGLIHSDVSCAIGKVPFNFIDYDVDIITLSGNKIYSGFGGGLAIFKSGIPVKSLILGGGQQNFKRGGTENIPQIFSLSLALEIVNGHKWLSNFSTQTSALQNLLESTVVENGGEVFAGNIKRVTNTSLVKMPNVNNLIQMMEFDLNDICISIGSACSSGKTDTSHVLLASGLSENDARQYIRISTGIYNTKDEMDKFLEVWKNLKNRK